MFSRYIFDTRKDGPQGNEALLEAALGRAREAKHSWFPARDTTLEPDSVGESLWSNKMSTCLSTGSLEESVERVYEEASEPTQRHLWCASPGTGRSLRESGSLASDRQTDRLHSCKMVQRESVI